MATDPEDPTPASVRKNLVEIRAQQTALSSLAISGALGVSGSFREPELEEALVQARNARNQLNHLSIACHHRADQLAGWKRASEFVSLFVTPGVLLLIAVKDNDLVRTIALSLSAVGGLGGWFWLAFGKSFEWENQLRVSDQVSARARRLVNQVSKTIASLTLASNSAQQIANKQELERIQEELGEIREILENWKVQADDEAELVAQQQTMAAFHGVCLTCGQAWSNATHLCANLSEAKKFLGKYKGEIAKQARCPRCGQQNQAVLPKTSP